MTLAYLYTTDLAMTLLVNGVLALAWLLLVFWVCEHVARSLFRVCVSCSNHYIQNGVVLIHTLPTCGLTSGQNILCLPFITCIN